MVLPNIGSRVALYIKDGTEEDVVEVETVSVDTDCVGYYVDINEEEEGPEGVIYIDIANTTGTSSEDSLDSYAITNVTEGLKEYYVSSDEDYEGDFGIAPVLSLVPGSPGIERFHVMKLEDVNPGTDYLWWDAMISGSLISEYETLTGRGIRNEDGVSIGKINTENMLEAWNATPPTYGAQNADETYDDVWGVVEEGWYIPSAQEWLAFGDAASYLGADFPRPVYWSSTIYDGYKVFRYDTELMQIWDDYAIYDDNVGEAAVRLGTTF